ncbi:MAG: molybdopterin molybdenumtransferase MoeA [Nevskiaceae bacterium]|nr:MAG: molybdopterin molybdenumtransferase MoeA [Nevskiaceae bacterium]TBR72543.1 MAG: molybdopterin molybdenumtransferase MoeA [Nevskiaceae bacterium]
MAAPLLDPDAALQRVLAACPTLPTERCRVVELAIPGSAPRILRAAVASPRALPPFDNSCLDGFALASNADVVPAGTELAIEGEQAAGDTASRARDAGHAAWAIMTGARVPEGLDRVIAVECVERLQDPPRIRLLADIYTGQDIRRAGSDVGAGTRILDAGTALDARHYMLLAALGIGHVEVATRPRVAVICTGKELVDDPALPLASGQIYNSHKAYFRNRIPAAGAELVHEETVGDDEPAFAAAFARARATGPQVMISSGAVSMGNYDFVPRALRSLGAEILFHKLAIRPGKPLLFARFPDGMLYFGLPGNPISAAVGLRFFVERALRAMLGMPLERPYRAPLTSAFHKSAGFRHHLKARLAVDAGGQLAVTVLDGQESYRIAPLAAANAWALAPGDTTKLAAGALVDVYGLGHLAAPQPVLP